MVIKAIREFIKLESTSGLILFVITIAALLISNSPWQAYYHNFTTIPLALRYNNYILIKPLTAWVNEGLMTLFFLLIGLEIKQEMLEGELTNLKSLMLPGIGAVGGMLIPAFIYFLFNYHNKIAIHGWAIPTATDTAFALAILSLFGKKIKLSIKAFLMTLAIFDDVLAIIIIGIFYNHHLSFGLISLALMLFGILMIINKFNVKNLTFYWIGGFLLWLCLLDSGVHAIIAGVILAITIPTNTHNTHLSPLKKMKKFLHPWVANGVLPLFIFTNAGISLHGISVTFLTHSIALGIITGLFIGKPVGIFMACWLAVKLKITKLIPKMTWFDLWNIAMLCGVGFTVSLFIGDLAFTNNTSLINLVKLGVLTGSFLSGALATTLLYYRHSK